MAANSLIWRACAIALALALHPGVGQAQETAPAPIIELPAPTGEHAVGYTAWHWIDAATPDPHAGRPQASREMMVHAWYPATAAEAAQPAPYRPLARHLHENVRRHSTSAPAFADLPTPAPVILLCPGRGVFAEYNTALAEELASHGYAVFAVDSLYTGRVAFPDGRSIPPAQRFRIPIDILTGPYEHVDTFFEDAVTMGAGDVRYALTRIAALNQDDPARRFTGRLDLSRMGIYGHSLGGRICGETSGSLASVRAFAAMEAVPPRDVRQQGLISGAVLMMYSSELPDMALPNLRETVDNSRGDAFMVRLDRLNHNSSTDMPLLSSPEEVASAREGLRLTRLTLLNFFDAYLGGGVFPADQLASEDAVTIEAYRR